MGVPYLAELVDVILAFVPLDDLQHDVHIHIVVDLPVVLDGRNFRVDVEEGVV